MHPGGGVLGINVPTSPLLISLFLFVQGQSKSATLTVVLHGKKKMISAL